jgi:Fur family ferric uptake transcriptional regulator
LDENNNFKDVLTREGVKNTKHRNAILEILEVADTPLTAEDIFLNLKEKNVAISLSTVYRTLETLTLKGLVIKANIMDDGRARFELNLQEHKHHVVCVSCHKMVPIGDCPFEEFEKMLKEKIDFDVTGHRFEIYGFCKECKSVKR